MRMLWFSTVCSICLGFHLMAATSPPTAVIDIDDDQTIMAYYKAGLHPVHAVGLRFSTLEFAHSHVSIKIDGNVYGPIDARRASLKMRNDIHPVNLSIRSKPMNTKDASALLYELAEKLQLSHEYIDSAIEKILDPDAVRITAEIGSLQIGVNEKPGQNFLLGIGIMRTFLENDASENPMGIQIAIGVAYPSKGPSESPLQPANQPLSPPAGYEHLPMDRELAEAMDKERGATALDDGSGQSEEEPAAIQQHQNDASRNSSGTAGNAEVQGFIGSASFWLLSSALIIGLIGWLVARGRR